MGDLQELFKGTKLIFTLAERERRLVEKMEGTLFDGARVLFYMYIWAVGVVLSKSHNI